MHMVRTCVACRKKNTKENLIRIVTNKDNTAMYDENQKENKRGIYICKNIECIQKLEKIILKNKFKNKIKVDEESLKDILKKLVDELEV